ncbi:hypothetical protein Bca52824_007850 [Brassica carinata]|uniref:Uncharacterized protein n=1 Tax=Brassica carinata TaxID=52824 RepID=A0A8X8B8M5_BRACI|nr:hypothetical protein Bca52824_007850 [Brassica carinata]
MVLIRQTKSNQWNFMVKQSYLYVNRQEEIETKIKRQRLYRIGASTIRLHFIYRWSGVVMIPKLNEMFRYLQSVYDSDSKEGPSVAIPGSEIQPK